MTKYKMTVDENVVAICYQGNDCCNYLEGFIDIFPKDETTESPFEDMTDAILFGEIIVSLLNLIK